jgi:exodeoxyribonuclease-3
MRITTWNVNGLRAALRKGFADVIESIQPDVLLLQEVRALPEQLPEEWVQPDGWHVLWHPAERLGYSGTAVWSRFPIREVGRGVADHDPEGRLLHVRIQRVDFVCAYLPSGSSSEDRQAIKEDWMKVFLPWARELQAQRRSIVMGGDLNIAHTEQDIFYAKSNEKTSGFLPHEREWFGRLLDTGWHDVVREHYGDREGPYSWWSNRGRARELDRGWRIDYLLANRAARRRFRHAEIHREGGIHVSDHAPVTIELK